MDTQTLLSKCFLFRRLSSEALGPIAAIAEERHLAAGEIVFFAEDDGDSMYLIRLGSVSVQKDGNELAKLATGSHFGEIALIDRQSRSATVKTLEHTELLVLDQTKFDEVLAANPKLAAEVYRAFGIYLCRRLRSTDEQLAFFKSKHD
jgi:CRP-like cAMP-binding protein